MTRRRFLAATVASGAAAIASPTVVSAAKTSASAGPSVIVGEGDYRYEAIHGWPPGA